MDKEDLYAVIKRIWVSRRTHAREGRWLGAKMKAVTVNSRNIDNVCGFLPHCKTKQRGGDGDVPGGYQLV